MTLAVQRTLTVVQFHKNTLHIIFVDFAARTQDNPRKDKGSTLDVVLGISGDATTKFEKAACRI